MFVLDELDKLLQAIGAAGGVNSAKDNVKISIPDIEPIDIGRLKLSEKLNLPYGPPLSSDQMVKNQHLNPLDNLNMTHNGYTTTMMMMMTRYPTSDSLFLKLMNQFVFSKLAKLPERHYPWAKLLICDRFSYDLLLKHERILSLATNNSLRNFLYRAPFVITAIFELDNIVTLFDRSGEPLIVYKRDPKTGKSIGTYSYAPIKKVFPYLRMSDLVIIIEDKYLLDTKFLLILQSLAYYARSFQLIELGGLTKIIGCPHLIYNNVLVFRPTTKTVASARFPSSWQAHYSQLPLAFVSFMATQLASLADKLKLRLETVTYRAADPYQQTRVFAHFLSTAVDKKEHDLLDSRVARVLVMDRFYDLRGSLLHADRFEAYLAQEKLSSSGQQQVDRPTLGSVDEQLNSQLHLVRLTEVLGVILKHATQLKPARQNPSPNAKTQQAATEDQRIVKDKFASPRAGQNMSSASQSIRRNLDNVKILYKSLNEGYLILLKLESSLESITAELRQPQDRPLDESRQIALAERLQRLIEACRQLIKVSSINPTDTTRLACLIADTINLFASVHSNCRKAVDLVAKSKVSLLREKDFKLVDSRFDSTKSSSLFKKYLAFDSLSASMCRQRCALSMDELVERMLDNRLDERTYPTNKLVDDPKFGKDTRTTIVLVLLGALTANELARIKLAEKQLGKQYRQLCDIIVLSSAFVTPDDFLSAL